MPLSAQRGYIKVSKAFCYKNLRKYEHTLNPSILNKYCIYILLYTNVTHHQNKTFLI